MFKFYPALLAQQFILLLYATLTFYFKPPQFFYLALNGKTSTMDAIVLNYGKGIRSSRSRLDLSDCFATAEFNPSIALVAPKIALFTSCSCSALPESVHRCPSCFAFSYKGSKERVI